MTDCLLHPIGLVRSPLKDTSRAPKQGDASCPEAELVIAPEYGAALDRLHPGQEVEVLTWLHLADRSVLQCHPRGDPSRPLHGVFATRSPDRPNPVGLHRVTILAMQGLVVRVHPLEAVDQTPVLDIKPALGTHSRDDWGVGIPEAVGENLQRAARDAWSRGLLSGFNGNLSCRLKGTSIAITRSGCAKGHMQPGDLVVLDRGTRTSGGDARASSESAVHLAVYATQPRAQAILHTHPPHLLALSLRSRGGLLDLPLFETDPLRERLTRVADHPPGSAALAQAVGQASLNHDAVFMDRHGLVCWADDPFQALALTEELESLARIALLQG